MNMYINNDSRFGHNRTQNNEPKRAGAISSSLAKKEYEDDYKGDRLMVESTEGCYRLSRHHISESRYFDNNRQVDFFDSYAPADSTSWNNSA
jgi:hypothetical protein